MVTKPSAHSATQLAVCGVIAGPMSLGVISGRVHTLARSTVTRPSWVTSSPASSARMMSMHSRSRRLRRSLRIHSPPVTCSLEFSPVPSAAQKRPSYMAPKVAMAWAMITG